MTSPRRRHGFQADDEIPDHFESDQSTNRTFRLSRHAALLLDKEARDEGKSANAIINQLLLRELRAERADRQLNPVLLSATCVRALLESVKEETVIQVASEYARDALVKFVLLEVDGVVSPKSVYDTMKLYNDVIETENDGKHIAILAHYAGSKYSLFVGTLFRTLFAEVGSNVQFTTDDNAVVFDLGPTSQVGI